MTKYSLNLADLTLSIVILAVYILFLVAIWSGNKVRDCGSFDISAYRLGNVPARCADYLINSYLEEQSESVRK